VDFDLRGWILLRPFAIANGPDAPDEIRGISVAQKCRQVHFLHATGGFRRAYAQTGEYVVHYQNGQEEKIPLVYGKEIGDWSGTVDQRDFKDSPPPSFQTAWTGENDFARRWDGKPRRLLKMTWINPHPDWEVKAIDAIGGLWGEIYLIAITAE
jgi:hypothetical protein